MDFFQNDLGITDGFYYCHETPWRFNLVFFCSDPNKTSKVIRLVVYECMDAIRTNEND